MDIDSTAGKPIFKEKALIKIIVLGCANVGKTSIMER
jgi:GTPase SAR1 family protein